MMDRIKLDEIACNIEWGVNAALAIHTAMEEGDCNPDNWLSGLYFVISNLSENAKALHKEIDG